MSKKGFHESNDKRLAEFVNEYQRSHQTPLRFGDYYAPRTQPQPDLPLGPNSKLADNYYYSHDGRREISPPIILANQSKQKRIETKSDQAVAKSVSLATPGNVYHWD